MNSSKRTTISQLLNLLLETDLCLGFSFLTLWAWVNIGTLMAAFASTFTTTLLTYTPRPWQSSCAGNTATLPAAHLLSKSYCVQRC